MLHASSLVQIGSSASEVIQASGNANPDDNFRYDSTLGPSGGYIFNLSTKGLTTGIYALSFTAGADPATHTALCQVQGTAAEDRVAPPSPPLQFDSEGKT